MPLPLHEERTGDVRFICPGQNAYQQTPSFLNEGEAAAWFALQNMVYTFIPHNFGDFVPFVPRYGEYAYNMGMGPAEQGFKQYSAEVVQPFTQADYLSFWIDPWHALLPDGPYTVPSALELIPEDAWITSVWWSLYWQARPSNWEYAIHSLTHTNTLLPQPATLPGTVLPYYAGDDTWAIDGETIQITPGTISARDACLQDFSMSCVMRHDSGTDAANETPILSIPYILMVAEWEGIEAINVTQWDDVTMAFGMTMAADIERQRNLDGLLEASMAVAGDVKLIGNLVGDFIAPLSFVADPTKDVGGVNTGADTTGYFNAEMSFEADMVGQLAIEGECTMSLALTASIEPMRNLVGSLVGGLDLSDAGLQKDGIIWVDEDGCEMRMNFNTPELLGNRNLMGAFNASMVVAADLEATRQLVGAFDASMTLAGNLPRILSLYGNMTATMFSAGEVDRVLNLYAGLPASLSLYGDLYKFYGEPAPSDQTITMNKRCNTINMGFNENIIIMDKRKRN